MGAEGTQPPEHRILGQDNCAQTVFIFIFEDRHNALIFSISRVVIERYDLIAIAAVALGVEA